MSKTLNLSELSSQIAKENIQKTDSITAKYIEEVIKHISRRGEKIEDYTLVLVSNPMRLKENNSLTVTMQYRICRVDELENMPEEDRGAAMTTLSNEQLRHRIVELRQQRGSHLIDESDYIEEVMQLFASQRQAILKEVREGAEAMRETRILNAPEVQAVPLAHLDALEKKYKGGEETPKEKI